MNYDGSAIGGPPGYPLDTPPNHADSGRVDVWKTNETKHESVDVTTLLGPANVPAPLHEPMPRNEHGRPDWTRLHALVVAVEALVSAGMTSEARPLVRELRALVEAAQGPRATVLDLHAARAKRDS